MGNAVRFLRRTGGQDELSAKEPVLAHGDMTAIMRTILLCTR